jgi:DNA-binding response OmpR family regulator
VDGQHSLRVLVVEDNAELRAVLGELLARHGFEADLAANGVEAMVALTSPDAPLPDVVILDVTMPLENGVHVLRFIRNGLRRFLPVIVLTASATSEQEEEIRGLGVEAYLRKPASADALLGAVRRVLRRA